MMPKPSIKKIVLFTLCTATAYVLFVPSFAYAYIDPATTSYIIQLAAGLVISLSVAFGVFFRRIQLFFMTLTARISALWTRLGSRQRYTSDKESVPKNAQGGTNRAESSKQPRRIGGAIDRKAWEAKKKQERPKESFNLRQWLFADVRTFRQRLLMALLAAAALAVTYLICSPLDLLISNRHFIPYDIALIAPTIIIVGVIGFVAMAVFLIIFKGRVFDFLVSLFCGVLVMMYVQGSFLNLNFGRLTGDAIPWQDYTTWAVIDSTICLVILVLPFIIHKLSTKVWRSVVVFACTIMIAMQLVSIITVVSTTGVLSEAELKKNEDIEVLTDEGLYDVAASDNIIVLLLDRMDGKLFDEIVADDPTFFDGKFDGFTSFTNYNSFTMNTFPSANNLLTGSTYDFKEEPNQYLDRTFGQSNFFSDLQKNGWSNYIYAERKYVYNDASVMGNTVENVSPNTYELNEFEALKKAWKLTLYVYSPHVAKPRFWMSFDEFSAGATGGLKDNTIYASNDHAFYGHLLGEGLQFSDDENEKRFAYLHLGGAHTPYSFDRDMKPLPDGNGTELLQARASYTILFEYLDQLKEMGLYEDATIIVLADHGSTWIIEEGPPYAALFVKPAGSADTPLEFNNAPVTPDSFRATVIQAAGGDYQDYGSTFFEVPEDAVIVRPYTTLYELEGSPIEWIEEWEVKGDVKDIDNWTYIKTYEFAYDFH